MMLDKAITALTDISIHAPQWGATLAEGIGGLGEIHFNPRTPVGCDPSSSAEPLAESFQSTHPSGVRHRRPCVAAAYQYFNPRTPVGCDFALPLLRENPFNFNPRTPVGCDHSTSTSNPQTGNFNPRTPVGCDSRRSPWPSTGSISIHAPQWGATSRRRNAPGRRHISIHAPQWGATRPSHRLAHQARNFNPRTPVGCDVCGGWQQHADGISIHAPQWGATIFGR